MRLEELGAGVFGKVLCQCCALVVLFLPSQLLADSHGKNSPLFVSANDRVISFEFAHDDLSADVTVLFDAHPGVPSQFAAELSTEKKISKVRVLAELDDSLLIVPLRKSNTLASYVTRLPTPRVSLTARLQVFLSNGEVLLSEPVHLKNHCPSKAQGLGPGEDNQSRMLKLQEAELQDQSVRQLRYVLLTIPRLLEREP